MSFGSKAFWAATLSPGEVYSVTVRGPVHLTQASLTDTETKDKTSIYLLNEGKEYKLCTLIPNEIEHQRLDIVLVDPEEPLLLVKGSSPIALTGMDWNWQQNDVDDDDDDDDEDFFPDEDDDEDDDGGMLQFYDPSDTRFMGGFQLEHFLGPSTDDRIDLRREESTEEDRLLNDNICQGLINSMLNSGNDLQVALAKEGLKRLEKQKKAREAKRAGKISKKDASGKNKQKKKKQGKHKKADHAKR